MGLLNTLLGRTKPVQSNLDALFALPSASITLQSAAGMSCSGHAGVCFKPPTGQGFEEMQAEVVKLLSMDGAGGLAQDRGQLRLPLAGRRGHRHRGAGHPGPHGQLVPGRRRVGAPVALLGVRDRRAGGASPGLPRATGRGPTPTGLRIGRRRPACPRPPPARAGCSRSTAYLVYLFKRGTFYPFVPEGKEQRNIEQELRLRSLVADDLTVEADLDRWFPLWDLPVG